MTTFRIVKTYEDRFAIVSAKGTSVTRQTFATAKGAEAWVARNYEGVRTVRAERNLYLQAALVRGGAK